MKNIYYGIVLLLYLPSLGWADRYERDLRRYLPPRLLSPSLSEKISDALRRWRPDEAEKLLGLAVKHPNRSIFKILAHIRAFQGRYREAISLYDKVLSPEEKKKHWLYGSVKAIAKVTRNYKHIRSPHFDIAVAPGPDELLVPYMVEALEKAYRRLGALFRYFPKKPVRVEILRDELELAYVSPLTEDDIRRTGTIALCKYNRVMITTPRVLVRGYRWLDTVVHEFTHLLINRIAKNVPIWLHEGIARYSEALWRSSRPKSLSPYSETLLARALRSHELITFKQMHPSMAKLPSQRHAALAYAQVFMVIRYFRRRTPPHSLALLLRLVNAGIPVPKAFSLILKIPFQRFLAQWKSDLKRKRLRIFKGLLPEKKLFKKKKPRDAKQRKLKDKAELDFWEKPTTPKEWGRRHFKLGEMLRRQHRLRAAIYQYLKAQKYWGYLEPKLQNKMARTYFSLRDYGAAIAPLKRSLSYYPNFFTTYYNLGRAYLGVGKRKQALKAFETANQINPFHPLLHVYLYKIYKELGEQRLKERERRSLNFLRRR